MSTAGYLVFHKRDELTNTLTSIFKLIVISLLVSSCTSIKIKRDGGKSSIYYVVGVPIISDGKGMKSRAVSAKGVGVLVRNGQTTIGYFRLSEYLSKNHGDCRIVIFSANREQLAKLTEILRRAGHPIKDVCTLEGN